MVASAAASRSTTAGLRDLPGCVLGAGHRRDFRHTRRMRRIASAMDWWRNAVRGCQPGAIFGVPLLLDSRHRDGGMADMTVLDYAMMVEDSHVEPE